MKSRALMFSSILVLSASLSLTALSQNDSQKPQNDQAQTQPAQTQPAGDQQQAPSAQQAPADQKQTPADASSTPADTSSQDPKASQDSQASGKESKNKHDGGKEDVDAIGNRKVGGLDWYKIETDIKIGKSYAMQLEQSMKMVQDPVVNEYVNRIGQNLVRNSDAKVPFTIKVVDADEINAMALPGGFFYVNSGLILAADDEAELAGVMAHEIAHVALRPAVRPALTSPTS
jgi:beta-barrel assembly-enhancing protease